MDKYELKVTIGEIDSLIGKRRLREAAQVADTVDWRRVKNVRALCRVSDVYKINRRYEDSKRILELAYAKNPYGRQIIFSLCELELKLGNYVRALQLYNEYINVAPRDSDRYVLQYKLYKEQDVSVNERIAVLEEMARHDMRDRWAFELAKLYLEAGERSACASQCDEIVAFFGDGKYVLKALELKASFTELTDGQKALYRKMTGQEEESEIQDPGSGQEDVPAAGSGDEDAPVTISEACTETPDNEIQDPEAQDIKAQEPEAPDKEIQDKAAPDIETPDIETPGIETPDIETPDIKGSDAGASDIEEQDTGTTDLKGSDAGTSERDPETPETVIPPAEAAEEETPDDGKDDESIPVLNREPLMTEIPWEYEDYKIPAKELKKKRPAKAESGKRSRNKAFRSGIKETQQTALPAADHSVFEDHTFEIGSEEEAMFSPENMQKTIAKGLRSLDNYDTFLMQETDGQYAMVMQEERRPDKQITGQLNLEEIMSECDTGSTKSWDPGEVRKALQIKDDDAEKAEYDTSLFVTEGGGNFPDEFVVEQMTLSTQGKPGKATGPLYLHSEDSIRQLTDALGKTFLEGGKGNVVITGDEGAGSLSLARELVRRYRKLNPNFVGQIAKTEGMYITRENVLRVIPRMPFGALIIERASMMSEEGAAALCEMITVPERSILIIMIDRKGVMDAFLNDHPRLREMFPARVDIAALSVDTLLGYAREYAVKQQCEIDEYGISALQSRILSMQTVEHNVTLEDIRDIVDEAVYYASRKTFSSLVDSFSRRKGGAQNRIVLRDKDFLHY